ncbi:class F sortase [Streptomyces sp. NBC_01003]|uniref:class F sortase n=1 Tax=Streptomyces sp. NBC_01003 TaxID=2903714 RepID=UPI00386661EF|nr:class F sortase [Streptomyces sp. NBC_01003]
MADGERPHGNGRLVTGVAWAVLLLGLWVWGREVTDFHGLSAPTTGDAAAVGRPLGIELPPAHKPMSMSGAKPQSIDVSALKIEAPVTVSGLDGAGAIDPPPFSEAGVVGWYGGGAKPGERGTALLVGHVDTDTRPAVFYHLSSAKPGDKVRVGRDDGSVAEFTVDDVQVFSRARFDAKKAYGQRQSGRAELRLITCGGSFDRASHTYTANVVVSAYLTGVTNAPAAAS